MFLQNYVDAGAPRRARGLMITYHNEGKCYSAVSWTVHRLLILHVFNGNGFKRWIWYLKIVSFPAVTASVAQLTVFWFLTVRVMSLFRLMEKPSGWLNLIQSPEDESPEPRSFIPAI
jgi:hypothetical protein